MQTIITDTPEKASVKTAVVVRYGIIGDAVMVTPVLRELKRQGYRVILHGFPIQQCIYENNPNIDVLCLQEGSKGSVFSIDVPQRGRLIDLQNSVESNCSVYEGDENFGCSQHPEKYVIGCFRCRKAQRERRERFGNLNMYEEVLKQAGLTEGIPVGEMFFSRAEMDRANTIAEAGDWLNRFVVLWSFSSTTFHKLYPYWHEVANEFCDRHSDAVFYTIGDDLCKPYEVAESDWIKPRCGVWDLRTSFSLMNLADLVIGGETGPMCVAGCFDTPKIMLMSNCAPENIVKHWTNVTAVSHNAPCHPCHQSHSKPESCNTLPVLSWEPRIGREWPVCQAGIRPKEVLEAMESWYKKFSERKKQPEDFVGRMQ